MEKEILEITIVTIIGQYGIQKCKERCLDRNGKAFGRIYTWFDVCDEQGDGDIMASFKTLRAAKKWAKEE